jgi:hypothetical protein
MAHLLFDPAILLNDHPAAAGMSNNPAEVIAGARFDGHP